MTFYSRNGMLYARINGNRVSTKLKDTRENRRLFESYAKNNEFFNKFDIDDYIPTILELCEEVLLEKESTLKGTSLRAYLSLYSSRIEPYFKDILVNEFKPKHVDVWYKTFKDLRTIVTCEAILKPAFEKAILREYIETTPFLIKRPKTSSEYKVMPFSISEIKDILENAPKRLKNLIAVAFYTGMRTGEVIGLKWKDIDFRQGTISVNRTITAGYIQTPKTASSLRVIDLISQCEFYLEEQKKMTGLNEYVFVNSNFMHYSSSSSLNYTWKKLLEKIKLEYRSIYQLRHSFASNMLSNGENELWVSHMLGHKSPDITRSKYSRYIKVERGRKITFLDELDTKAAQPS